MDDTTRNKFERWLENEKYFIDFKNEHKLTNPFASVVKISNLNAYNIWIECLSPLSSDCWIYGASENGRVEFNNLLNKYKKEDRDKKLEKILSF